MSEVGTSGGGMNSGGITGRADVTEAEGVLQLRFRDDQNNLTELSAADVAEVLQGLVAMASDFATAGVFGDGLPGTLKVRPPREGSFILEVTNWIQHNPELTAIVAGEIGAPSLGTALVWATKSARAEVKGVEYLDNGEVLLTFSDDTVEQVPLEAWDVLRTKKRKRKKQLRQIMAPLSNPNVTTVEVRVAEEPPGEEIPASTPPVAVLDVADYRAVVPVDEVEETSDIFEAEAQMVTVDFDSGEKWRVRIPGGRTRTAAVEDTDFLAKVNEGLALHKSDIFRLRIREDRTVRDGRNSKTTWTVLKVVSHRRGGGDADDS